MAENRIIAFDLGSNSIGATIRNPYEEEQFEKAIVITFDTGVGKDTTSGQYTVSLAANRTSKRSVRRLYQSRKYKLWTLLETLIQDKDNLYCPIKPESLKRWKHYDKAEAQKGNGGRQYPVDDVAFNNWIKLDFNNDGIPDYISPYQLRQELATVKLDFSIEENRFKLGRALYHIAQHRGFKSSKIVKNKDDEKENKNIEQTADAAIETAIGAERKKQERFYNEVIKLGFTINQEEDTIGSIFALIENEGIHHPERKTEGIRIRKELHQFVTRKLLIKEVKKIFEFQELDFGAIFKDKNGKSVNYQNSTIFKQRPLRSQKGLVGVCTLENKLWEIKDSKGNIHLKQVGKKRCPVSRPEFEEFRALAFLNNIEYRIKGNKDNKWKSFVEDYKDLRDELYKNRFFRVSKPNFEFVEIYNWLKEKNGHDNWELNYNYKTNVPACSVSTRLQKLLGEKWNEAIQKKDKNGRGITIKHIDKDGTIIKEYPLTQLFFEDVWHVLFESDDEDFISEYAQKHNLNEKELVNLWYAMPVGYAQLSLKAINNILPFLREGYIYTDAVLLAKVPEILGEQLWTANKNRITDALKNEVIAKNRDEKRILNVVNNLIAQYKALPKKDKFAEDKGYIVNSRDNQLPEGSRERDAVQILTAIEDGFGKETWKQIPDEEKEKIKAAVTQSYQAFFNSSERKFYALPRLADAMKNFIRSEFETQFKEGEERVQFYERVEQLYHPSMLDIYPKAKEEYYKHGDIEKRMILLGSPQTGSWKNPMALRTLHELKKLINYLIATGEIDEETRVVVEVGRELVDTNKRWAYETYQKMREEENKEFAEAIRELIKREGLNASPDSDSDLDKFRLWYEMLDSAEGYEKNNKCISVDEDRTYGEVKKKTSRKGKRKAKTENEEGEEERYYTFNENHFDKIKKEVWLKLKKAKDNVEERYRLWKEQQYFCIYTGKPIKISDLFNPNLIDVEHTIPRSISFDNSLANKTVCYADFNRNAKKNKIPTALDNYDAIKQRIEKWEQKVKDLEVRVEFWKGKSKRAATKDDKDACIRQKHLWQFELDYWRNKVERFTMKEVKAGFKNSQLKDTQLISKYAFHYLKSYFNKVDVQKGAVTAEFRKIFNIQKTDTPKDRSKHSHHAKDAMILSLIPVAAIRDKMLEVWYKIEEKEKLLKSNTENKAVIEEEIKQLKDELNQLKFQCNLPKGLNETIKKLDEILLINNIDRNRSLLPASKKIKVKGKLKIATGDAIRGQLHLDTFYGKIQMVERNKDGIPLRDENGKWKFIEGDKAFKFVLRKEVDKNLKIDKIVDPVLKNIVEKQIGNRSLSQTLSEDGGLYMLKKDSSRAHKIRHIRCFADDVNDPVSVKEQTTKGNKEYKNHYWAKNGENILCALYQKTVKDKKTGNEKYDRTLEIVSLKDAADLLKAGLISKVEDIENNLYRKDNKNNVLIDENGNKEKPYAILKPDMKVIFYDEKLDELKKQDGEKDSDYNKRISYRTYKIVKFAGNQITFQHHLEARNDNDLKKAYPDYKQDEKGNYINNEGKIIERSNKKERISLYGVGGTSGFTRKVSDALTQNNYNDFAPWPKLLYTVDWLNMAIEGKHFEINPDGIIKWKF